MLLAAATMALVGCHVTPSTEVVGPIEQTRERLFASAADAVQESASRLPSAPAKTTETTPEVALAAHQVPAPVEQDPAHVEVDLPKPESTKLSEATLDELEATALANNPAVAEADSVIQSLQGRYVQAGLGFNPSIGYMGSQMGEDERAGMQGAYVEQEFIRGNKLGLSQAVVAQEIRQAQLRLEAARLRVLTDVRLAHYDSLVAQRRAEIARQLDETSRQALDVVDNLVRGGEGSGVDLLQAEVEVESAGVMVQNADAAVEGAWRRLAASMGVPDLPRARVSGSLEDRAQLAEYETIVARTIAASPQLAGAQSEIYRARWAVERARVEAVPNVTAQAQMQYDYGSENAVASLQVGLPLPIYNRNEGGVQEAFGELRAAEHAARRMELSIEREIAQAYQDYVSARQRVERYADQILPRAADTLDLTRNGYQTGEFSFIQLLTVQRTYFQTNLAYLDALAEMGSAGRRMNGLLLTDSLQSDVRAD